ncbi:MAG: flavodoxin family protein [Candidatus Hodarchaeales archaeon]
MTALILNGELKKQNKLIGIQRILENVLTQQNIDAESIILNEFNIRHCIGCFKCWEVTPGICSGVKGDHGNEIVEKIIKTDLLIFLTPLTFGAYSSELKRIIERMLGLLQPGFTRKSGESHHHKRYDRYPSLLAIASTENLDEEEIHIFNKLIYRHSLNFYPPKYNTEVFQIGEDKEKIRERLQNAIVEMELKK